MNDWGRSVLEQYDLKIESVRRGRGALLCETDEGLKLLQACGCSERHLEAEFRLLTQLREHGFSQVDRCVRNREGALISEDAEHRAYILKDWYEGNECGAESSGDWRRAVETLARLHESLAQCGTNEEERETVYASDSLCAEYERHNRELLRVRNYIRTRKQKSVFERLVADSFADMYAQAQEAKDRLETSAYPQLYGQAKAEGILCHGSYHHHNVLIGAADCAVTNFQKACVQVQLRDLYHFMRKILEKHGWREEIGYGLLNAYAARRPLADGQLQVLAGMFAYPEKYWKQLNYYRNGKKAWIPEKNMEKLALCIRQETARRKFIAAVLR